MTINEYKEALKNMIDATDDEQLLKHWKTHLEGEFEKYRQGEQTFSAEADSEKKTGKDDDEGYVILESGLGIDE